MSEERYYEEYDDQNGADFDLIGIAGEEPVPITDILKQVAEYRRTKGKDITIYVYKEPNASAVAVG